MDENYLTSLQKGEWRKLICGASYQDIPSVRNLALAYSLAGVNCVDVAADEAVIKSAWDGITVAKKYFTEATSKGYTPRQPLLMVSVNDGEDLHFRKALFNAQLCPSDCQRPCLDICPTEAIKFTGVVEQLCYGCGRCLPICPYGLIEAQNHLISMEEVLSWLDYLPIGALEIHTHPLHWENFCQLWEKITPYLPKLQLIAISCAYTPTATNYLSKIAQLIQPLSTPLIWQVDGRSMSGDIGKGTTHLTIKYAQELAKINLLGYIQLAGGTNEHTAEKVSSLGLSGDIVAGIAFGSQARKLLNETFSALENQTNSCHLEDIPALLWQGVNQAHQLINN
ncbi:MAG: 4Fe-4S ferredoxin [Cyanobacterium sp. T60_A2020_053]|nr:4Fe-4S ferredoxin [Cyanobacterium sp. T60_A2020_053]